MQKWKGCLITSHMRGTDLSNTILLSKLHTNWSIIQHVMASCVIQYVTPGTEDSQ